MGKRKNGTSGNSNNTTKNAIVDNPLAAARSGKVTTTTKHNNKKNTSNTTEFPKSLAITKVTSSEKRQHVAATKLSKKAELLWHKRSGAGFQLFVEYYKGQPRGVVVDTEEEAKGNNGTVSTTKQREKKTSNIAGAGQSRAARRRKKKKRKIDVPDADARSDDKIVTSGAENTRNAKVANINYTRDQLLYHGRLLDILDDSAAAASSKPSAIGFRDFLTALSKPLSLTFRFRRYDNCNINSTSAAPNSAILLTPAQRKRRLSKIKGLQRILESPTLARSNVRPVSFDKEFIYQAVEPPISGDGQQPYPFPIDKASLKRYCPQLKEFLNGHTNDGTIARQELGSMLPVWLLDKIGAFHNNNHHSKLRVLDTCASPGSKTLQVAEIIASLPPSRGGRVRANDVNANRLESLRAALLRSGFFSNDNDNDDYSSNSENEDDSSTQEQQLQQRLESLVRFSNLDASRFPIPKSEATKYPIILCDVPCSGDGTVRKDVHVIPNWTPSISNALHSLQLQILQRAMACVAVHGIISYSTCSLNPIEDEAVVLAALQQEEPKSNTKASPRRRFELVNVPKASLNGLVLHPGVDFWRVADFDPSKSMATTRQGNDSSDDEERSDNENERPAELQWYDSYQSALEGGMEGALETMWPGVAAMENDDDQTANTTSDTTASIPLERCLRLFPQDQDTGGFFVALIRRIA